MPANKYFLRIEGDYSFGMLLDRGKVSIFIAEDFMNPIHTFEIPNRKGRDSMVMFKDVGGAIDYFDEKVVFLQGFLKKYPNDKAIQETIREYVEWRAFTVYLLKEGYEKTAKFVNSLRDDNGYQLFSVPIKQQTY